MSGHDNARRDFVKRAVYVAPVVVTLAAAPSFAKAGSVKREKEPKPKPKPNPPERRG